MKIFIRRELKLEELENGEIVIKGFNDNQYTEEEYKEFYGGSKKECMENLKNELKQLKEDLKIADKEDKQDIRDEIFELKETLKELKDINEEKEFYLMYDSNLIEIKEV